MSLIQEQKLARGRLLANGRLYIGVYGSNEPELEPITLYKDYELTQPVTAGNGFKLNRDGFVTLNGKQVSLYASTNYSFQLKTERGCNVFTNARQIKISAGSEEIDKVYDVIGVGADDSSMGPYESSVPDNESIKQNVEYLGGRSDELTQNSQSNSAQIIALGEGVQANTTLVNENQQAIAANRQEIEALEAGLFARPLDELLADDSIPVDTDIGIQSLEYTTGSGVGAGLYKKVSVDPGFPLINPPTNDGNFLELVTNGVIKISQTGAKGDGVGDESDHINQALNSLTASGTVVFDLNTHFISSPIVALDMPDRVEVNLLNAVLIADPATMEGETLMLLQGVDNNRGDRVLDVPNYTKPDNPPDPNTYMLGVNKYEVTDASGIEPGDWLQFFSLRPFDKDGLKQTFETQRVWEVDGNTVYTGAESKVAFVTGDTMQVRQLTDGLNVLGGRFIGNDVTGNGLVVKYFNQPNIENIDVRDCFKNGIFVQFCCQDSVRGCTFKRSGIPESPEAGYQGIFGYGLIHARNCYSNVYDCVGREGWHTFEAADGQRDITYHNCMTLSDGHGFSQHENCVSANYFDCTSQARLPSINRARYVKYKGGSFTKTTSDATFFTQGWEFSIDNSFIKTISSGEFIKPNGMDTGVLNEPPGITPEFIINISNCTIESTVENGICSSDIGSDAVDQATFSNNVIKGGSLNATMTIGIFSKNSTIKNNSFLDGSNGTILQTRFNGFTEISGNCFLRTEPTNSLADAILIRQDSVGSAVISDNTFTGERYRYAVRSLTGDPTDIEVTVNNCVFMTRLSRGLFGKMQARMYNNVWNNDISLVRAYDTANPLDTVIISSSNDYFFEQGAVYGGAIETNPANVISGFIYSNAGVLTVKP